MRTPDVLRVTGLTYRQLDHWTRAGWVTPTNPDTGTGHPRDYPMAEVKVAERMAALVRAGVKPPIAHSVARGNEAAIRALAEALRPIVEAA